MISPSVSVILQAIPPQLPKRAFAGPAVTVTREDADAAVAAVRELLEAVKHEGEIRAINGGCKGTDWRSFVSPALRAAYVAAGGC